MSKDIIQILCDKQAVNLNEEKTKLVKRVEGALTYFQNSELNSNSISNLITDLIKIHGLCTKLEANQETVDWFRWMKESKVE